MFVEAIILSLIIGLIRGGKLKRIKALNTGTMLLLLIGIVVQYFMYYVGIIEDASNFEIILKYSTQLQIVSYILILIGIVANIRFRSLWVMLVGYVLNFVVFVTNGWRIPNLIENSVQNVKFPTLGYTIKFFEPYPIPNMLTLGDLIISFAVFALIQEVMIGGNSNRKGYRF